MVIAKGEGDKTGDLKREVSVDRIYGTEGKKEGVRRKEKRRR